MAEQLSLFPEPFRLQPSPAEIWLCTQCHKPIALRRRDEHGNVISEYASKGGKCYSCSFPAKERKLRLVRKAV